MNLLEAASLSEDEAREHLESLRWPNGPVCPHCGCEDCTRLDGEKHRDGCIQCNNGECRQQFTVTVGSVMESSKVSLRKWVLGFHLLCSSKKGFSAKQLQRELGLGSYRTAWFMLHRIRHAMSNPMFNDKLNGTVEVDETYVGGKTRGGKRGRGADKKTPVMALVERDGTVRSKPVENVTAETLQWEVVENVDTAAIIVTDELASYTGLENCFADHHTIQHKSGQYVRVNDEDGFKVHTNTVESFFSLVKRSHHGVYHSWSKKHLHRYIDECAFRWNHRKVSDAERRDAAVRGAAGKRLRYETPRK